MCMCIIANYDFNPLHKLYNHLFVISVKYNMLPASETSHIVEHGRFPNLKLNKS